MQIKYVKDPSFSSDGVSYFKDEVTEVSNEIGTRLVSTFPGFFEVVSKPEVVTTEQPEKVAKTSTKK